jgi:hypothetical protein
MTHPTDNSTDSEIPSAGQPASPSLRSLEQQLDEIGALALASATRLTTDEKWRLEIQKQLF